MQFRNEFYFLSNMYPSPIKYNNMIYPCVESAFQAQKDPTRAKEFTFLNGFSAKKLGRRVNLRSDWNTVRIPLMEELLRIKFSDLFLKRKLLAVKDDIVEDNTWGDTFWGMCNGVGQNRLGQLLMKIREEMKNDRI